MCFIANLIKGLDPKLGSRQQLPSQTASPELTPIEKKMDQPAAPSPATQRLTEISKSDSSKAGRSRLRRAFSFTSAADLRRESHHNEVAVKEAKAADELRRQRLEQDLGAEQAAIAEQQEASGLGESIYSYQSGPFLRGKNSADGMSVSSTASSASMMLRKMGKGMKRSGRSIVGLFRPKSVANVPPAEVSVGPMEPKLSVVNVEAEGMNEGIRPVSRDLSNGGAKSPPPESSLGEKSSASRNAVEGDRERAEILAAVNSRKSILKSMFIEHVLTN